MPEVVAVVSIGAKVWVPAEKGSPDIFTEAEVLAIDEFSATVRTVKGHRLETLDLAAQAPLICNPTVEGDMTGLHYIHEPGILYNLEQRSYQSFPYTFMGSVLCAVNPLKPIPNPSEVGTRKVLLGAPHPYAVSENAFQQMTFQGSRELVAMEKGQGGSLRKASQSIVIGGESGAGKTESAKMVLQQLVTRQALKGDGSLNGLDDRLLGTNPILEAFGNATTLRNPNSSRFGKMLRLHFNPPSSSRGSDEEWVLKGATVQSYLLERSRVTTHEPGERGYHIMYYVVAGCADKMDPCFDNLKLEAGPENFSYCKPLHEKLDAAHNKSMVPELVEAMKAIGFSSDDMKGIFEVVAAILHMGNIEFGEKDTNDGATSFASNPDVLNTCATLFGVEPEPLTRIFCERRFEVAGNEMMTVRNARAAGFARDAVAKAVYSGLFDLIMAKIDVALGGAGSDPDHISTIGVLDIFGFETFQVNGFEQLLINYTNEALQGTFNSQIFIAEAALYQKEGLYGADSYLGQPADNSICVELLQGIPGEKSKEQGLLMTIDSEGRVPDPSDSKMNQRLHSNFAKHPCMVRPHPKDAAQVFIIRHYAETVTYTIGTFLEKNNDRLPDDMESTLKASTKTTLKDIFHVQEKSAAAAAASAKKPTTSKAPPPKPGSKPRKPPAKSIVHKFQGQIKQLIDDLEITKCSFIRCVKPNAAMKRDDSDPTWFDRKYVQKQLNALNVSQTAEVLRNGFPTRIEYATLVDSYVKVLPESALKSWQNSQVQGGGKDNKSFTRALFYAFDIDSEIYKLGLTRVFFKGGKLAELDAVMKSATSDSISQEVVKKFTYFYARVKWRRAAVLSLCQNRMLVALEKSRLRIRTATKIQAFARMQIQRAKYKALTRGAIMAQKIHRGRVARKAHQRMLASLTEAAKKRLEDAKIKADKAAIEQAEQAEREIREAVERKEREEKERAEVVERALEQQKEERDEEEALFNVKRRSSMLPARTTVVGFSNKVAIRGGGKLRPKPLAPPPSMLPPPPPPPDDDDIPPPPPDEPPPEEPKRNKRSSFFAKIKNQQEEDFQVPTNGWVFLRSERSRKSVGIMGRLKGSNQYKWDKYYFVLVKPDRKISFYKSNDQRELVRELSVPETAKLQKNVTDKSKPYASEITDTADPTRSDFLAFEKDVSWKKFCKDFELCVVGFKTSVPAQEESRAARGLGAKQVDLKIVAQLNLLLFRKQITQKEFDDLLQNEAKQEQAESEEASKSKLTELGQLPPLKNILAENIPFDDGKLSCGCAGIIRKIDHVSFEEIFMLGIDMRFSLNEFPDKPVGWQVAHKFREYKNMFHQLSDSDISSLTSDARLAIPAFPQLDFGSYAKRINREHNEKLCKEVEVWMQQFWKVIPQCSEDDYEAGEEDDYFPGDKTVKDPNMVASNWRSVRDPETGEIYWNNKITGDTRYEDPTANLPKDNDDGDSADKLPPGWEEILDPETDEVYYFNEETSETTWDRPVLHSKPEEAKTLELKDILHVDLVNKFFDLQQNVDAMKQALAEQKA